MFNLAHLSDVHLPPLPHAGIRNLCNKRLIGWNSWRWNRRKIHLGDVLQAIRDDIKAHNPSHIAFTGDLANIALPQEFLNGATWLKNFAPPDKLTFVPGNHDSYVNIDWQNGLGHWADYMTGDLRVEAARPSTQIATPFPFVRQRRNIALIGLSTAVPAPWRHATGLLGNRQIKDLTVILDSLFKRGFYRIVMIHHPPLPGLAKPRKALLDAEELQSVLKRHGADLVLHGHNHQQMQNRLETKTGPCHILGVPSASAKATENRPAAAWNHYAIRRQGNRWLCDVSVRGFDANTKNFTELSKFSLEHW